MPTVLWIGGLRVVVYFNDHRSAHVHVIGNKYEAVFELDWQAVTLRENYYQQPEIAAISEHWDPNLDANMAWERIRGKRRI